MSHILIIGCGNPVRGDDGLGWHAAQKLSERYAPSQSLVEITTCQQLTMDLVEPVHQADFVIFIDAAVHGPPGTVTCQTIEPGTPQTAISHYFDPPTLLACVQSLYGACPAAMLISIVAASFDYGEQLSPIVAAALPALLEKVREVTSGYLTN